MAELIEGRRHGNVERLYVESLMDTGDETWDDEFQWLSEVDHEEFSEWAQAKYGSAPYWHDGHHLLRLSKLVATLMSGRVCTLAILCKQGSMTKKDAIEGLKTLRAHYRKGSTEPVWYTKDTERQIHAIVQEVDRVQAIKDAPHGKRNSIKSVKLVGGPYPINWEDIKAEELFYKRRSEVQQEIVDYLAAGMRDLHRIADVTESTYKGVFASMKALQRDWQRYQDCKMHPYHHEISYMRHNMYFPEPPEEDWATLSHKYRAIYRMRTQELMNLNDIARIIGCSREWVVFVIKSCYDRLGRIHLARLAYEKENQDG